MDLEQFKLSLDQIGNTKFHKKYKDQNEFVVTYTPKAVDRILVTYPKCGTAWTIQIIYQLINTGSMNETGESFFYNTFNTRLVQDKLKAQPTDNSDQVFVMRTHFHYDLLPFNERAQYLLVLRNPKDVVLSFYLMHQKLYNFSFDFHEYFEHWITGSLIGGDYFDFVKQYWIHCKNEKNFLILVYEEMKRDIKPSIETIAQFLGQKYMKRLSNENKLIDEIIEKSSFDSMKEFYGKHRHFRKGIVGDWRSVLTKEESDLIDKRVEEEWMGTGLELLWNEDMKWIEK